MCIRDRPSIRIRPTSGVWSYVQGRWRQPARRAGTTHLRLARSEFRRDVCDRSVERDKLRIVELGYLDAKAMVDRGDEVQEIHRIDVDGLTKIRCRIDVRQINLGGDIVEFFLDHFADVEVIHSLSGSCSSLPISAKNSAPACPSLTRWSADSVMVTTERGPMAPSITHGRVTILPKQTIATLSLIHI